MFRKTDKGIIREYMKNGQGASGEPVLLKIYQNTIDGDPTTGKAKTFQFVTLKDFATVGAIEQQDIVYSGGIYMIGDIKVQLLRELQPIDDTTQSPGDRLVWRGNEYRQVGKVSTNYLEGYVLFNYVMRRI